MQATIKETVHGSLEIVRSPSNARCIVNPTVDAQRWALQKFFEQSKWDEVAKCARNLRRLAA